MWSQVGPHRYVMDSDVCMWSPRVKRQSETVERRPAQTQVEVLRSGTVPSPLSWLDVGESTSHGRGIRNVVCKAGFWSDLLELVMTDTSPCEERALSNSVFNRIHRRIGH